MDLLFRHPRIERLVMKLVWRLPRWLIYWAAIRIIANGTTGIFGSECPDTVSPMTILKRWSNQQGGDPTFGQSKPTPPVGDQEEEEIPAPEWFIVLLDGIGNLLDEKVDVHPFENTGEGFRGKCFWAHSYNWDEDWRGLPQSPNFVWRDLEVRFYKHLGRSTTLNRTITPEEGVRCFEECARELEQWPTVI